MERTTGPTTTQPATAAKLASEPWRRNLSGEDEADLTGPRPASWWTGPRPEHGLCAGVGEDGVLRAVTLPDITRCGTAGALAAFDNGWAMTEVLFSALQGEEAFYRPPHHHLRHPLVFYYAHPAVLHVNKLRVAGLLPGPVDAAFERLFETGVDEMSWDDLSKNDMRWPRVSEVTAYRRRVYGLVRGLIEQDADIAAGTVDATRPAWAFFLGFEHERIHIETSSVLIRELPVRLVRRPPQWPGLHPSRPGVGTANPTEGVDHPTPRWVANAGGDVVVGKDRDVPTFGWDNEYGRRPVTVAPFRVRTSLVSNGEFLDFVREGAYAQQRWWSEEGWRWRTFRNERKPTFWVSDGPVGLHRYLLRTLFEEIPMPWDWPALVNHHEARAFAAWRTARDGASPEYRLLTEGEHHALRSPPADGVRDHAVARSGVALAEVDGYNLGLAFGSESPVEALRASPSGVHDLFGNAWQWAEDHFAALPGFRVHPLYDDFSTPCFDGEHNLILGGSHASTGDEASVHARFHFRRHFHQLSAIRLVQPIAAGRPETTCMDAPPPHVGAGPCCTREGVASRHSGYEAVAARDAYLLLHYGSAEETLEGMPAPAEALRFPQRCAQRLIDAAKSHGVSRERALDVGCAVGGATFALAREFESVLGVDLSAGFTATAERLRIEGGFDYERIDEGDRRTPLRAAVDADIDRSRVTFRRADACALPPDLGEFDVVLAANLLCRLPSPRSFLSRLGGPRGLVRPGGLLLLTTPFTWREEFTPREAWLGGREVNGRSVSSADALSEELSGDFELIESTDLPLLIREHRRKYEWIVAASTLWRRL
jgi:5-histidylcysteine sulfoxide synthase/putative 4-mercaptohistidine N1-methyltranferase